MLTIFVFWSSNSSMRRASPVQKVVEEPVLSMDEFVRVLAEDARYVALCRKRLEDAQSGNPEPLAEVMAGVVREFSKDGFDVFELAKQTHVHTMHAIGIPVDHTTSREIFTRLKSELAI